MSKKSGIHDRRRKGFSMKKCSTYVGMDVDARSIIRQVCVVDTGEASMRTVGDAQRQWISSTGSALRRSLRALGVDCDVIAITTLARSDKDKKNKCDKLDAKGILAAIMNPMSSFTCVWCPDEEVKGARDLARLCDESSSRSKGPSSSSSRFCCDTAVSGTRRRRPASPRRSEA